MERILADHAMRNRRKAQAVLRLGQRYGATALDQACGPELRPLVELLFRGALWLQHNGRDWAWGVS